MKLVETHQIKKKECESIDKLCFLTKNLYNYTNYAYRRVYFENKKRKEQGLKNELLPNQYELMKRYAAENQTDYRELPAAIAQKVISQVSDAWKSYFAAIKDYAKHPENYDAPPQPPKYKDKTKGRCKAVFAATSSRIKNGYLHFAKATGIKPVKTNVTPESFCESRIIPCGSVYKVEIVYEQEVKNVGLDKNRVLGIDLGVANLATLVDNTGERHPIVIKGGKVKSENQWYNKQKAYLQTQLPEKCYRTKQIDQITLKRNNRVQDALHKTSRFIVEYCIENNIGTIVVGKNEGWKKEVNIGKKNNQKFVQIPHAKLIEKILYKAQLLSIDVLEQEESHTSKCDALAWEPVEHHKKYLGTRKYRGLFASSTGKQIHADVNGGLNILRKAIGDHNLVINWGRLARPVSVKLHV